MSRARLRQGRQASEIGAAIVEAWLRLLPTPAIIKVESVANGTLQLEVGRAIFIAGQFINLRREGSKSTVTGLKVGPTVTSVTTPGPRYGRQQFTVFNSNDSVYVNTGGTFVNGLVIPQAKPVTTDLEDELGAAISQVIEGGVTAVAKFDTSTTINVGVPMLPRDIYSKEDLLDYLRSYHQGESRHYHDELGVAVLFGCR
jgi:hypothetical protein